MEPLARTGRSWLCPCRAGRQPGLDSRCRDFVSTGSQLWEGSDRLALSQPSFQENTLQAVNAPGVERASCRPAPSASLRVKMGTPGVETRKRERTQQRHTHRPSPTMERRLQIPTSSGLCLGTHTVLKHHTKPTHHMQPPRNTSRHTLWHSAAHRFTQVCTPRPGPGHTRSHTCTQ